MKNYSNRAKLIDTAIEVITGNKSRKSNLYVAFINKVMIGNNSAANEEWKDDSMIIRNNRQSIFSTTGGAYYINGVPAILSQNDEEMLYEYELSEYY